mmetsp:Transcript_10611/g.45989  ORF Transcript_10611/g.45989 Transcript_10611/m.45989 type:complete len:293 (+) Transcript_10611:2212-3090(+)
MDRAIDTTSLACLLSISSPDLRAATYDTKIPATVSELRCAASTCRIIAAARWRAVSFESRWSAIDTPACTAAALSACTARSRRRRRSRCSRSRSRSLYSRALSFLLGLNALTVARTGARAAGTGLGDSSSDGERPAVGGVRLAEDWARRGEGEGDDGIRSRDLAAPGSESESSSTTTIFRPGVARGRPPARALTLSRAALFRVAVTTAASAAARARSASRAAATAVLLFRWTPRGRKRSSMASSASRAIVAGESSRGRSSASSKLTRRLRRASLGRAAVARCASPGDGAPAL